jgi:hypothetical protein
MILAVHTVFYITVQTNGNTGTLCLVDLAGSRPGNVQDASPINKSMTNLRSVITALVTRNTRRIPYRNYALTHMLEDSLGGPTKTSFIVTISPATCEVHNTLQILDCAKMAIRIVNRPEVNQSLPLVQVPRSQPSGANIAEVPTSDDPVTQTTGTTHRAWYLLGACCCLLALFAYANHPTS